MSDIINKISKERKEKDRKDTEKSSKRVEEIEINVWVLDNERIGLVGFEAPK